MFVFLVGSGAETHSAVDGGEIFVVLVADGLLSGATVVTLDYALAVRAGELEVAQALLLLEIATAAHGDGGGGGGWERGRGGRGADAGGCG